MSCEPLTPKQSDELSRAVWPNAVMSAAAERLLIVAMHDADAKFQAAGAAGTKYYIRDFLVPEMEKHGLKVFICP